MIELSSVQERWSAFAASKQGRRIINGLRAVFVAGILAYLVYRLSQIGWAELWTSLPQTPFFYLTVAAMYFILPVAESLIYGMAWKMRPRRCLSILLRKRVLNADVLGYSGEVYLFAYARKHVSRSAREIALVIKDNLILSSVISISTAILLLIGLLLSGQIALEAFLDHSAPAYVVGAGVVLVLGVSLFVRFRGAIFHLDGALLGSIAGIHAARFLLGYVLQVVQWWVVLPDAPFSAWATLLVVFVVMNRIPFLPSRDLIFAGAGIELSSALGVPVAAIAGMLLVRSAIDRVLNFGFFAGTTWLERRHGAAVARDDVEAFQQSMPTEDEAAAEEDVREKVSLPE